MRYYIDGYNLMFRTGRQQTSFTEQRGLIISTLSQQASQLHLSVTIVFDAYQIAEEKLPSHLGDLEIRYTAQGETADDWILALVAKSTRPHQITVVTSDRELATRVRQNGARTLSVETFNAWLDKRSHRKIPVLKKPTAVPSLPSLPPPQQPTQPPATPALRATFGACFEYYLYAFGNQDTAQLTPPEPLHAPPSTALPTATAMPDTPTTEEDWTAYYQRMFERNLNDK